MKITTLTSPIILRKYMTEDETLRETLRTEAGEIKIYPVSAPEGTVGDFIVHTRIGYGKTATDAANREETTTIEVEICSTDYDRLVLVLLDAVRRVVIRMRNDGIRAHITDCDEYRYAFVDGGQTWYTERVTVTLTDIMTELT